ncbi:MAG: thiamine-monophosphate kinase [Candidatus Omnitrophica bacterium]|nr:thiamine-monophosphate kinase [Candidatus Omnitrophota bacterium]MBD3269830.1 thiamine-monophosphate kinase [Candidatus Omnitrophota bacterium]
MDELEWVDFLKKNIKKGKEVISGIGDDCALVRAGAESLLLKSDTFVEGTHFRRGDISLSRIGARAVARVFSDFAACGGRPLFAGISLGAGKREKAASIKRIMKGAEKFCRNHRCSLIGGDTTSSPFLFLDVWGVGKCGRFVPRSGARRGDYIFVTGKLGRLSFSDIFEPKIKEGLYLARRKGVHSMCDISDGFFIDLYRILKESKKGALLYGDCLDKLGREKSLYRGEDYELIFTVSKSCREAENLEKKFILAGEIKPPSFGYRVKRGEVLSEVTVKGYNRLF